jgi:hypothetical protein
VTLPATTIETEALDFARNWLGRHSGNPWSEHPNLSADAGRAFWRHMLWQGVRHPVSRLQVIAMARAGDVDADAVLRTLMIEMQSRGETLPTELAAFNMEILHGGLHQPPGPKRKEKILRDLSIALAVAAVCDRFDLSPTRNTASRGKLSARRSACAIVADALNMGEKAVEAIWTRLAGAMPTVPGWGSAAS